MQIFSISKNIFTASLLLFMLACNSNSGKEKKTDKKQSDSAVIPPAKAEISPEVKKCYANDGLNYKTVVTLLFYKKDGKDIVSGNVTSEELGSGKTEKGVFEGTIDGDKLMVRMMGNPPAVGDASEWTDKPWSIKKEGGKETLRIVFNAKNYETNTWSEIDYQFVLVNCK